jgi:hypothetical protein
VIGYATVGTSDIDRARAVDDALVADGNKLCAFCVDPG